MWGKDTQSVAELLTGTGLGILEAHGNKKKGV